MADENDDVYSEDGTTTIPDNINDLIPDNIQDELTQVQDLIKMDPSYAKTPEYAALMETLEPYIKGEDDDSDDDEEEEDDDSEESDDDDDNDDSEDDDEEEEDDDSEESDDDEEEEDENDIFGSTKKSSKKPLELTFDPPKGMNAFLKNNFGVKDPSKFFETARVWRDQAQEGVKVKADYDGIVEDIDNLPPDIRKSIALWSEDEDYTAPFIAGQRLDFEAKFNDQYVESLVQHYLPDDYDSLVSKFEKDDDFTEEMLEEQLQLLANSTKKAFNDEQKVLVNERADYVKNQDIKQKAFNESAIGSVEKLSKTYPNFKKTELKKIRRILVEGDVDSLIYNPDGTYLEGAAEFIANAMYGGKITKKVKEKAKKQGKSEANREFVDSSPKNIRKKKAADKKKAPVNKEVQSLVSMTKSDSPY